MKKVMYVIISTIVLLVIMMGITMFIYRDTFGIRYDVPNKMYDIVLEQNPEIKRTKTKFMSEDNELTGYFYYDDEVEYKGLIVVAHGMGNNHASKLSEISEFVKDDYVVFAYDNTGTSESEGKNLVGLSQSAIDLKNAINYIATIEEFKDKDMMLFGHSWGGFAVAAVNNFDLDKKPTAIVAMAGFNRSSSPLKTQGRLVIGPFISIFMPFVTAYENYLFPEMKGFTGMTGLEKTDAKVLIIQSVEDDVVEYENFEEYEEAFGNDSRFKFMSLEGYTHRVNMKKENIEELDILYKKNNKLDPNGEEFLIEDKKYNNLLINSLDSEVMGAIISFFNENIINQ